MDAEVKKDILYRPCIDIERNYNTDGFIAKDTKITGLEKSQDIYSTRSELLKRKSQSVVNELLKVMDVVEALPLALPDIFRDILEPMTFLAELNSLELDTIYEEDIISQLEEKDIVTYHAQSAEKSSSSDSEIFQDNDKSDYVDSDETTYRPFDIEISTIAAKPVSMQLRDQYLGDLSDITAEFARNLNGSIQGYLYPLSTILNELGLESPDYLNFEYEGESVIGIDRNLLHLNDRIVIQESVTEQLAALMAKTHRQSALLDAIRAFDAAEALRERYYSEEYNLEIKTDIDIFNNNLLKKSRDSSEAAYRQAKINLFKFLDSSVEIMKDICSKKLEAQQAKAILLKNNVNIYAHKAFETVGVENSASDTQKSASKISAQTEDIEKNGPPTTIYATNLDKNPIKDTKKAVFEALDIGKTAETAKNTIKNEVKAVISEQNAKIREEINASLGNLNENLTKIL